MHPSVGMKKPAGCSLLVNRSIDDLKFLRIGCERFTAILRNQDIIFDSHTADFRNIDSRFDCVGHSFPENSIVGVAHGRELMDIDAKAMADAVREVFSISCICDDGTGDRIKIPYAVAWLAGFQCGKFPLSKPFRIFPVVYPRSI